ncbi:MAG: HypC/HybG/HupF family hydrogenase formation chaperone [Methylococcales bacterium]|nr:HypC/HybG/HupF family hydrogenase formation chaperone [Methylococcales bacterium]
MCLAVLGQIIAISGDEPLYRMGKVTFSGIKKEISLAYLPEAKLNDYVIVHAGFALSIIDENEARESLNVFQALEEFEANL